MSSLVHIVDDDPQVRAYFSYLISGHGYSTEVYANGAELLREGKLDRGCILLDLRMPEMNGHEVQEELLARGIPLPVIVMSGEGDLASAVRSMKLGASDFLQKPVKTDELLAAIERAIETFEKGEGRRRAQLAAIARVNNLSAREQQILKGLVAGLSNKEIARMLGLSPRTVEMHRGNMMSDLGISSLSEAVRLAIDAELEPLDQATANSAAA